MQGQQGHTVVAMIRSRPQNPKLLSSTLVEGLVGLLGEWQQQREGPPQPPETDQNSNAIHHSYISPPAQTRFLIPLSCQQAPSGPADSVEPPL